MTENENRNLKELAEDALLRSIDDVSDDKEIIQLLKDKVIIIKENNKIEIKYPDVRPLILIPLYLIGKFIGCKVLKIFDSPAAKTEELASNLNLPPQALSRPLGILAKDLIDSSSDGYKIRAFKILNFLKELESSKPLIAQKNSNRQKAEKREVVRSQKKIILDKNGLVRLNKYLNIPQDKIIKILFFREDEASIRDIKFAPENIPEKQLYCSLAYLLVYKYLFNMEEFPAGLLRKKLRLLGVKSLVNLSSNLHNFPEDIVHKAGPRGSKDNFYIITISGEEKIKEIFKKYLK